MKNVRDERLAWAEAKLREYEKVALKFFRGPLTVELKADQSPVTIADRTIEERLRRDLSRAFPRDVVLGEEFGKPRNLGDSFWTIDPIDGTRAFSKGLPSWGMLLSYVERGVPVMGACRYPIFDTFIGTGKGVPAYERVGGRTARLPKARPMALARAALFHGGAKWFLQTVHANGFKRVIQSCYLERAYGDCFAYLWVLRGKADAVLDCGVKIWDIAPFAALARATGRVLTDFSGRPTITGPQAVLAHPSLNREIVRLLRHET